MIEMVTNKANWSGEDCTVRITDTVRGLFTIGMDGYTFQMTQIPDDDLELYKVTCLECPKWTWLGQRLGRLASFAGSGISREDDSAYLAFAKLAWNVI